MTLAETMLDSTVRTLRNNRAVREAVLALRTRRARRIEREMNIDTVTVRSPLEVQRGRFADGVAYEPLDYPLLRRYLRRLSLGPHDVVFDIGCGMGRILCLCGRTKVGRCVGIEIAPELAERARENATKLIGRASLIEIRTQNATEADYTAGTVFILFNPFGHATLDLVLDNIRQTLVSNPRKIRIAYLNPVQEFAFERSGWLECVGRDSSRWYRHKASYWESRA